MPEIQISHQQFKSLQRAATAKRSEIVQVATELGVSRDDLARQIVWYLASPGYVDDLASTLDLLQIDEAFICRIATQLEIDWQLDGLDLKQANTPGATGG